MHPYVFVPMASALLCATVAGAHLASDPHHPANRRVAAFLFGASVWAVFQVLWNLAEDPARALAWMRASGAAWWVWLGPVALHLLRESNGGGRDRLDRWMPIFYATSAGLAILTLGTPWMLRRAIATPWGFAYEVGPAFPAYFLFTVALAGAGMWRFARSGHAEVSPGERSQRPWVLLGACIPLVVASLTDAILPMLRIHVPHLAPASCAAAGVLGILISSRFGYLMLAPGGFAGEILAALPDGVALLRTDGRIRTANDGMAALLGVSPEALAGLDLRQRLNPHPFDPPRDVRDLEAELQGRDGRRISVSVSSNLLRDNQGLVIGVVLVARDLREVVELRNRLLISGRLAAVGELAAGIAHEINNPIAFVRANLGVLRDHWDALAMLPGEAFPSDEKLAEGREIIEDCLEGVDRAAAIVKDVKNFSHAGAGGSEEVDLNTLVQDVLRIANPQVRHHAQVETRFAALPPIPGRPQELKQVFLNLVLNAAQALCESGRIVVSTEVEEDYAVVVVEDDGCGIAPEVQPRIFDPFFTTKPVGEGTGLGLAIAHEIVRTHRGDIRVQSQPGQGTCFRVRLPRRRDERRAHPR